MTTLCLSTTAHDALWTLRVRVEPPVGTDPRHDLCGHWGTSTVPLLHLVESMPGVWCGEADIEPECEVVGAQWIGPDGLTGEVVAVPEPGWLVAGLVLLAVLGRWRP